jgi:restriction system protein
MLGEGLAGVLEVIEGSTGKPRSQGKPQKESTPRQRRPRGGEPSITPRSVLRSYIIQSLTEFGGSARGSEVIERMQEMLKDQLTPMDREIDNNGQVVWKHNAHWERQHLVNDGILRNDSKRGYWELNPDAIKQ